MPSNHKAYMPHHPDPNYPIDNAVVGQSIAVSLSSGIRAIQHIQRFIGVSAVLSPAAARRSSGSIRCVVTWGRKNNNDRAASLAQKLHVPLLYLEDGWIRSCEKDAHSRKCYSLLVDTQGVYYDPAHLSDLECALNLPDDAFESLCSKADLLAAEKNRQLLVDYEITKYNYCKEPDPTEFDAVGERPLVLVIDQTLNDASVLLGAMDAERFQRMLDTAVAENPQAEIVVRVHPDVVKGGRQGYLIEAAQARNLSVSASGDNPMSWLKRADKVYVGTSQLGYEALLCGCKVIVFGKPFYAGWGLTDDRAELAQRTARRSINQLFYIAHEHYARYINPMTGGEWALTNCIQHVIEQKRNFMRNALHFICVGITPWKRRYLERYLRSPEGSVSFSSATRTDLSAGSNEQLLTWSFRDQVKQPPGFKRIQTNDKPRDWIRVEDGFLRSCGLGSDYVAPQSLVVDSEGLYFDRHQSSELETLLNSHELSALQIERARALRESIVQANMSKYSVSHREKNTTNNLSDFWEGPTQNPGTLDCTRVLVVGQVEDDESIKRGCGDFNSNSQLIKQVRNERPNAWLVYKPHPDVVSGNRRGAIEQDVADSCVDEVPSHASIISEIDRCDELHTMTSLSGFEALIRQKVVFTYGMPFYAGWGLTHDHMLCERRTRLRSLDELVYLSLIAYPRYLHVESGEFMTAEQLIEINSRNVQGDSTGYNKLMNYRWLRKLRNIKAAIRYAA